MPEIQKRYTTQMAGEFYAAGELFKRGFFANVSFGNAKSFDIVAFSSREDRFARIEVKSSRDPYFTRRHPPVYEADHKFHFNIEALNKEIKSLKTNPNKFYVFVALGGGDGKPDFFVFQANTIYKVMRKKINAVPTEKVHGRWDLKLSDIFESKGDERTYQREKAEKSRKREKERKREKGRKREKKEGEKGDRFI